MSALSPHSPFEDGDDFSCDFPPSWLDKECLQTPSECPPICISNVVVCAHLGCRLDLRELALRIPNVAVECSSTQRFRVATLQIRTPQVTTVIVHDTGAVRCMQATSVYSARRAIMRLAKMVQQRTTHDVRLQRIKVANVVGTCCIEDMSQKLLEYLAGKLSNAVLIPEISQGLQIRGRKSSHLRVFATGKCIVLGVKSVGEARELITQVIQDIKRIQFAHPDLCPSSSARHGSLVNGQSDSATHTDDFLGATRIPATKLSVAPDVSQCTAQQEPSGTQSTTENAREQDSQRGSEGNTAGMLEDLTTLQLDADSVAFLDLMERQPVAASYLEDPVPFQSVQQSRQAPTQELDVGSHQPSLVANPTHQSACAAANAEPMTDMVVSECSWSSSDVEIPHKSDSRDLQVKDSNAKKRPRDGHGALDNRSPARARVGQHSWRRELAKTEQEWRALKVGQRYPPFAAQAREAKKAFKSQRVCVLLKLQLLSVLSGIVPLLDPSDHTWLGFHVMPEHASAFRWRFDCCGLEHKSLCNMFRRAGFEPKNRKWEQALNGVVAFVANSNQGSVTVASE